MLRLGLLTASGCIAAGCKGRIKRYDPQPKRGLLEDRWPGYYFDSVTARYPLRLANPDSSLSRPSGRATPIVSSDQKTVDILSGPPTIRPTHAMVELQYDGQTQSNSQVQVTVHWPRNDASSVNASSTIDETMNAAIAFDDIRRFIDGTGRFRCDRDQPFYGQADDEKNRPYNQHEIDVQLHIAGPNPGSRFDGIFPYRDSMVLYRLAKIACPGLG